MFATESCKKEGCGLPAASGSDYCIQHSEKADQLLEQLLEQLRGSADVRDLVVSGASLRNLDLS